MAKGSPKPQKSSKQVIIDFIVSCLENGEPRHTILAKVVKKWQTSPRSFDRMLKIGNEQYRERQELASEAATKAYVAKKADAAVEAVMSKQERLEYLTKIVKGEVKVPYTEVKWNPTTKAFETIKFVELAGHTARINAIAELNKMEGDYAPIKKAITDSAGKDIPPPEQTTESQFQQLLQTIRETKNHSSQ